MEEVGLVAEIIASNPAECNETNGRPGVTADTDLAAEVVITEMKEDPTTEVTTVATTATNGGKTSKKRLGDERVLFLDIT